MEIVKSKQISIMLRSGVEIIIDTSKFSKEGIETISVKKNKKTFKLLTFKDGIWKYQK